jgi:hypothetical protein
LTETPAHRNTGFDPGTAFQPLADFLPAGRQNRGDQARPLRQRQLAAGTGAVFLGSRAKTEALGTLVQIVQEHLGKKIPTFPAPLLLLQLAAGVVQTLTAGRSPIHPARMRKVATSTHIVPQVLPDLGFKFRFDFRTSLQDWAGKAADY